MLGSKWAQDSGRGRLVLSHSLNFQAPEEIEDITWPRGDTKFLFECFTTREEKFPISKRPCNVLFII